MKKYVNPYEIASQGGGEWLRSNFHTHAGTGPGTCGIHPIDDVAEGYRECGYRVMMISNHDLITDTREYAAKYCLVTLSGYEYSRESRHIVCVGVRGEAVVGEPEEAVAECVRQGGFAVVCHPHFVERDFWPLDVLLALKGYAAVEIFNSLIFRLTGTGLATDIWDGLLSAGRLVWGFGNDDFHRWTDLGKSWDMIYTDERSEAGVIAAVKRGSFYVSSGLNLDSFTFADGEIQARASAPGSYLKTNRYIFTGKDGRVLREVTGESAAYKLKGDETYVRLQVISEHGHMLWTQPVYDSGAVKPA